MECQKDRPHDTPVNPNETACHSERSEESSLNAVRSFAVTQDDKDDKALYGLCTSAKKFEPRTSNID